MMPHSNDSRRKLYLPSPTPSILIHAIHGFINRREEPYKKATLSKILTDVKLWLKKHRHMKFLMECPKTENLML